MALQMRNSIFFHVPKTGGTWVRQAIRNAGIPTNEIGPDLSKHSFNRLSNIFHCAPGLVHSEGYFTFAFVRNPLSYYQSYWSFKMRTGADNIFDKAYMDEDFLQFVRNVIEGHPGWVSALYKKFLGPNADWVDYVGRQESLRKNLIQVLHLAGENFQEAAIYATNSLNEASSLKEWSAKCKYTSQIAKEVYAVEKEAIELYGYQDSDMESKIFTFKEVAASPSLQNEGASSHEGMVAAAAQPSKKPSAETS